MKSPYILALLALIRLSTSQDLDGQPQCALPCWQDFSCAQLTAENLSHIFSTCLIERCSNDDALIAAQGALLACDMVGAGDLSAALSSATQVGITTGGPTAFTGAIPTAAATRETDVSTAGESSSDTASTTGEPSSTLVSSTSTSTSLTSVSSSTSASTPTNTPSSSSSSGLNPAAIGLGVGIGVGGLLIILLALFLFRRHRKRRTSPAPDLSPAPPPSPGKVELPNTYITEKPADDDPTNGRAEAPPHETRYEIPTNEGIQGRHELGSNDSWHQRNP